MIKRKGRPKTNIDIEQLRTMRNANYSYTKIALILGLPRGTIADYCLKNGLKSLCKGGRPKKSTPEDIRIVLGARDGDKSPFALAFSDSFSTQKEGQ